MKKDLKSMILLVLYKEMTEYYIISDHNLEEYYDDEYIEDHEYVKWLFNKIVSLTVDNIYSKQEIKRLEKLILKYKNYIIKKDNKDLLAIYDIMLVNLKKITEYDYEFLKEDYEAKYENLSVLNKLSGIKLENMIESMNCDVNVLINILGGKTIKEIDDKYSLLAIKKFIYLYSDMFNAKFIKKNTQKILKKIIATNGNNEIKNNALKLLKIVSLKENKDFSIESFIDYYYCNLIVGLVTNSNFKEYFSKLDEKEILHPVFIDSLKFIIELHKEQFDKNIANNLLDIVNYIHLHYKDYYSINILSDINNMKITLNTYEGNNREFIAKDFYLKEDFKGWIKPILYNINIKKNFQKFADIKQEIFEDEYFYSFILKSYMVSDEEFMDNYYNQLIFDDNYIKNIRKLLKMYPICFMDDQIYTRTKKIINDKIKNGLYSYSFRKEHEKVIKKINKYNID